MKNFEYLSEQESKKLTLSSYLSAARRTLEERYERRLFFESNPSVSEVLKLTPADRRLLRGMKVKVND
jgi:hypothetical protein